MRIKLLNNGGYGGFGAVKFPVEVETRNCKLEEIEPKVYIVGYDELKRIGANVAVSSRLHFVVGDDCEVVKDE